jgi:hypothetical protein
MAGDPTKVAMWANADVYIAPVGTTMPTDVSTALAVTWKAVGLLDGDEGFQMTRNDDVTEKFAWGGILVKRKKSKHVRTIRFVALEDNAVTFDLANPGSTSTLVSGLTTREIVIPVSSEHAFIFELREGTKVTRRLVKRGEVTELADITEAESEVTVYDCTATIYPDSSGVLFTELSGVV